MLGCKLLRQTTALSKQVIRSSYLVPFSTQRSSSSATGKMEPENEHQKNTAEFLTQTFDIMLQDALIKGTKRSSKVVDFKTPQQLMDCMDFSVSDSATSNDDMLDILRQTVAYSIQTGHPRYFNQLYAGRNQAALAGAYMVEALNTNVHTFETAPVFSVAEIEVLKGVCRLIGYEDGDGIFMSGGSLCNMTGIHLARYRHDKTIKQKGLYQAPKMALFSTVDAHYSVAKGASFMGFGTDSIVKVATDNRGRMDPDKLDEAIQTTKQQGIIPLVVIATTGTTVLGSFDPVDKLADVCRKHGCWLHVDACWGGGVMWSEKHKHLLKGMNQSDSLCVSFHKLQGAHTQCAAIMTKHKGLLRECNMTFASYLFQPDKQYYDPAYDLGNLTIQCGRKADGFKLWLLWKARGNHGMAEIVDKAFQNARYFTEKLKATEGFQLVLPEFEYVNISFWYIPPSLRGQPQTPEWWEKISKVGPKIKERMLRSGQLAIAYQPLESMGFVNFFRIIIESPDVTTADLDFAIDEIHRLGQDL